MNPVSSTSNPPVPPAAAAASNQPTIASLQSQMARYTQVLSGQNSRAISDYRTLEAAIRDGNVAGAQSALTSLQRDNRPQAAATTNSVPANSNTAPTGPSDTDGDHDGTTAGSSVRKSLNTTA